MSDDLKCLLKDMKKTLKDKRTVIIEKNIPKCCDSDKQRTMLSVYLDGLSKEIKKSSEESKYLSTLKKETNTLTLQEIRFIVEKSYDRYDRTLELMNKYKENFDENDFVKYNERFETLSKVLIYMVENHIGEYSENDSEDSS